MYRYARSEAIKRATTVTLTTQDIRWLVEVTEAGNNRILREFESHYSSVRVELVDRMIRSTGELNLQSNILITDNDNDTDDFRLCILRSGQSWLSGVVENCA